MPQSRGHHFCQQYNAQTAADAETLLIVGARVHAERQRPPEAGAERDDRARTAGAPQTVLADNGYASEAPVAQLEERGHQVFVAPMAPDRRQHDFRLTPRTGQPTGQIRPAFRQRMANALRSETDRTRYSRHKPTVEPVFGVIQSTTGFRQFQVRGLAEVAAEWLLVALAYTMQRLHNLSMQPATA